MSRRGPDIERLDLLDQSSLIEPREIITDRGQIVDDGYLQLATSFRVFSEAPDWKVDVDNDGLVEHIWAC